VERFYKQEGNIIFETEFLTDLDKWDTMAGLFNEYLNGLQYNGNNVSNYETYMFILKDVGSDNAYSFEYYPSWQYTVNASETDFTSIQYASPDGYAVIDMDYQNDNKTYWSKGEAGQWAIDTLESYYAKNVGDLKIDSDQINDKGYEQLNWHTLQQGFQGITVFYANGTQIMKLNVAWQKDYAAYYQSALEYVITTFASPAQ